ncbi:MAG TPA: hypothetical protein VHY84_25445 [Bryobacteraceae bacterium]|nr:hypothetical protein [Bryobacteraceae bacterium]
MTVPAQGQTPQAPASPTPAPPTSASPTPGAQSKPAATSAATSAPAPQKAVPDYPDPRTLTLGVSYWLTGPGTEPSVYGGNQALDYETLTDWGRPHRAPGIEASVPITRTGELHLEYFRLKGDGNQTASVATDVFGSAAYNPGDYLATQYQVQSAKLYLEDLLWPHKFPVAKFRVRSLWEVEWVQIKSTVDAPYIDATGVSASTSATEQLILPAFGLSAEYAIAPHVLLKASASGFGLWHKADVWDAEATIGYRWRDWEIRGGAKTLHFKTSPNNTDYESGTFAGAFVGLRWHWSL